jgi:transposase
MTEHGLGVVISKDHVDVFDPEDERAARFESTKVGLGRFRRWIGSRQLARVVYEPTGPCHRLFEASPSDHLPLVKVNPLQARRFAQACGTELGEAQAGEDGHAGCAHTGADGRGA